MNKDDFEKKNVNNNLRKSIIKLKKNQKWHFFSVIQYLDNFFFLADITIKIMSCI